jgi:conjugative transfer pilus assembly protein TraH
MLAALNLIGIDVAQADVNSELNGFFNGLGGAANASGPAAYNGQMGGYYTGGHIWARVPQSDLTLGSLQLPSVKAGCGGIDLFTGGFSFINSDQLVAAGKAVANGALMFVFQLALKSISSLIDSTLMDNLQKLQQMIQQSKSSCELGATAAAGLMGSVGIRNSQMCKMIGNAQGFFADWAKGEQDCSNGGQTAGTLRRNSDIASVKSYNYTWASLTQSYPHFDGSFKEYLMSLVGTVIYTAPGNDTSTGSFAFMGGGDDALITALLDGGSGAKVYSCRGDADCLTPSLQTVTIAASVALKPRVYSLMSDIRARMMAEQTLTSEEVGLLGATSIPLYKILIVDAAASYGNLLQADLYALSEAVATDLLETVTRKFIQQVVSAQGSFQNADDKSMAQWRAQLDAVARRLEEQSQANGARVQRAQILVERAQRIEATLRNQMAPQMSAALQFDRSLRTSMSR